jgi:hypothetical protein
MTQFEMSMGVDEAGKNQRIFKIDAGTSGELVRPTHGRDSPLLNLDGAVL